MNRNSNLSPLPFFRSIEEQSFRQSYAYGINYPLIAPKDKLLPFQIVAGGEVDDLNDITVTIYNFDGDVSRDISSTMRSAGLVAKYYEDDGYSVISFPGMSSGDFSPDTTSGGYEEGEYRAYLKVEWSGLVWYSDVMTLIADVSDCLKVEWYSYSDIVYKGGRIAYKDMAYTNVMYVMREIGMPTYDFSDSGEDRNGYYFATKQISEKTYHFSFLATEAVCDALRIASLSDVVMITDQLGREYLCDSFLPTPTWQSQGYLASVDCEFQCDTMVVRASTALDPSTISMGIFYGGAIKSAITVTKAEQDAVIYVVPSVPDISVTGTLSWVTVKRLSGNSYKLHFSANTASSSRTATLTFTSPYATSVSLSVSQSA